MNIQVPDVVQQQSNIQQQGELAAPDQSQQAVQVPQQLQPPFAGDQLQQPANPPQQQQQAAAVEQPQPLASEDQQPVPPSLPEEPEIIQPSADHQLAGRIISYIESLPKKRLSWFWQLVSNAVDAVNDSVPLIVKVVFKENCIEFSHSGRAFTAQNLFAIVNQSTTKQQELGLGFLSVIALTGNIELQGLIQKGEEQKQFVLPISRSVDSVNKLVLEIKQSKQNIGQNLEQKFIAPFQESMTTRFRLFIKKQFDQEVQQIKQNLLFLFAFNKQLTRIEVVHKGKSLRVQRPPVRDRTFGCKWMRLDLQGLRLNGLLFTEENQCTVGLPVHCAEDKQMTLEPLSTSIFIGYPLEGQSILPFVFHSQKFKLDVNRQSLKEEQNIGLLKEGFNLFLHILPTVIGKLEKRELLLQVNSTKVNPQLLTLYKKSIANQPIIKTAQGVYCKLSEVELPIVESRNYVPEKVLQQTLSYFNFCNSLLSVPLDPTSFRKCLQSILKDLSDWLPYIKTYQLKSFIDFLSKIPTFKLLAYIQANPNYERVKKESDMPEYVNQLYKFLQKEFPIELFNPQNKIAFNNNYKFTYARSLYQMDRPLPVALVKFAQEELKIEANQILLCQGVNPQYFYLKSYQVSWLVDQLKKSLDRDNLQVADLRRLFKFCSIYVLDQTNSTEVNMVKQRKLVFSVLRHLNIFGEIQQTITDDILPVDYREFVKRLVHNVFGTVVESLKNLDSLSRILSIRKQQEVIQWFNSFQSLLNNLKYPLKFNKNLNRSGSFENTQKLMVNDGSITDLEIEIYQKLPKLPLDVEAENNNDNFKRPSTILLHPLIDEGSFSYQGIRGVAGEEMLEKLVEIYNSKYLQLYNQRAELILDYCDDLDQEYRRTNDQVTLKKVEYMQGIRTQIQWMLGQLRLTSKEDKQFIWRLMKEKPAFLALKDMRKEHNLGEIMGMAGEWRVLREQTSRNEELIKKAALELRNRSQYFSERMEEQVDKHKSQAAQIELLTRTLSEQKQFYITRTNQLEATRNQSQDNMNATINTLRQVQEALEKQKETVLERDQEKRKLEEELATLKDQEGYHERQRQVQILTQEIKKQQQYHNGVVMQYEAQIQARKKYNQEVSREQTKISVEIEDEAKNHLDSMFGNLPSSRASYNSQIGGFLLVSNRFNGHKVCLKLVSGQQGRNMISDQILDVIYKGQTKVYIGLIPKDSKREDFMNRMQIYSIDDTGIDKSYTQFKDFESKKNAKVKRKLVVGIFKFYYIVDPGLSASRNPMTLQQFRRDIQTYL